MKVFLTLLSALFIVTSYAQAETAESYWVEDYIERVSNFPKKDINFLCYPELLQNPDAFHKLIQSLAKRYEDQSVTKIVGLEARGFIFGVALAYEMNKPFVMMRKKGKLPRKARCVHYGLEYGKDAFELEEASIDPQDKVLIVDDILATGGTAAAAISLVEELGASVCEVACMFELANLEGRKKVPANVFTMLEIAE